MKTSRRDPEVYELLHSLWLILRGERGRSGPGDDAIKRIRRAIEDEQYKLIALERRDQD